MRSRGSITSRGMNLNSFNIQLGRRTLKYHKPLVHPVPPASLLILRTNLEFAKAYDAVEVRGRSVDDALQFTIVVADGRHTTALRGGGGGTFGVITSVTYQTHPSVPPVGAFFRGNFTSPETAKGVITESARLLPRLGLNAFHIALNTSWEAANVTWIPFFDFARNASTDGPGPQTLTVPFDSFSSWYQALFSGGHREQALTSMR
ncbi:hypothetical protein BDN71DRAFT_1435347 [Pleurotus eryngii]|uniref:Uncharacterized protein n=1 Tax=Pleurotus eryngii TaxID=5323 RepID=A0A9P5ZPJ6_PLEER|nr:hypothetical protein BDN71DRAFT_1435347 [Pleurotus eryngii]